MIVIGFLHGILTRVGSAFTASLNMQCWKLELTEIVNRKCKLFILSYKEYALFCNLLTKARAYQNLKWSYSMLVKTK